MGRDRRLPQGLFDSQGDLNRKYLESDLLTGALELSDLHQYGVPPLRQQNFSEAPGVTLSRLLATVEPGDLSASAGALWARARAVWKQHGKLTWDLLESGANPATRSVAAWMREHGLGLGLHAPVAAKRLLALRSLLTTFERAQQDAAAAVDKARDVLSGT